MAIEIDKNKVREELRKLLSVFVGMRNIEEVRRAMDYCILGYLCDELRKYKKE